jgi:hypothetical protein
MRIRGFRGKATAGKAPRRSSQVTYHDAQLDQDFGISREEMKGEWKRNEQHQDIR